MKATLKPSDLPEGHPAITKNRRWTAAAKRVLNRPIIRTRYRAGENIAPRENPVRNTKLFFQIAEYLENFPESWEQGSWGKIKEGTPCGTAFCIAGTAAHETGWLPANSGYRKLFDPETLLYFADPEDEDYDPRDAYKEVYMEDAWQEVARPKSDVVEDIQNVGAFELGLTYDEQEFLFDATWKPREDLTVSEALREIGLGACIPDVSKIGFYQYRADAIRTERGKIRITGDKG